jgi:hypothetical protein
MSGFVIIAVILLIIVIFTVIKYRKSKKKFNKSSKKSTFTPITPYIFDNKCETEKSNFNPIPINENVDKTIKSYEPLPTQFSSVKSENKPKPSFKQYKSIYDCLLHNPKWLSCRQKILERDNYKCQWCGSENNLQIHHKYYCKLPNNKLVNPWEYKEDCFMTLCKQCHEKLHQKYKNKVYYRSYGEQTEVLRYINKLNKR